MIVLIVLSVQAKVQHGWEKEKTVVDHVKADKVVAQKIYKSLMQRYEKDDVWKGPKAPIKMRNPRPKKK